MKEGAWDGSHHNMSKHMASSPGTRPLLLIPLTLTTPPGDRCHNHSHFTEELLSELCEGSPGAKPLCQL